MSDLQFRRFDLYTFPDPTMPVKAKKYTRLGCNHRSDHRRNLGRKSKRYFFLVISVSNWCAITFISYFYLCVICFAFQVTAEDNLPQFICQHCLQYLHHAYEMRLQILSSAKSLRLAASLTSKESIELETHIDQSRITKREVEEYKDEAKEETHFSEQFKDANIHIRLNLNPSKTVTRAIEQKCPSCRKRLMSVKSLNDHMDQCEISVLDSFFGQFKNIYSKRLAMELTTNEFVLYAIKLLFQTQNKLQRIVEAKRIDVNAITEEMPEQKTAALWPISNIQRKYQSPDNGYISGGRGRLNSPR